VEKLHDIGLEAPQGRELIYELSESGIKIDTDALSENECTEALVNYLREI
jgi:hypothetical protein